MGNAGVITVTSASDVDADKYEVVLSAQKANSSTEEDGTEDMSFEVRHAEVIHIRAGIDPSYALIAIRTDQISSLDESAFTVALKKGGPADRTKLNMRASVYWVLEGLPPVTILSGTVTEINHGLGDDSVVLEIKDDKWLLSKFTIFGQLQFDPTKTTNKEGFVSAEPCIFNWLGYPNLIEADISNGTKFRFAPEPRFGWKADDTVEPVPGSDDAKVRSRSWTVEDSMTYVRDVAFDPDGVFPGQSIVKFGKQFIPSNFFNWPEGLGSGLSVSRKGKDSSGNDTTDRSSRLLHNHAIEGATALGALDSLVKAAGPFELFMFAGTAPGTNAENKKDTAGGGTQGESHGKSTLSIVSFEKRDGGLQLVVPGIAKQDIETAVTYNGVADGYVKESINEYYHGVTILGDPPVIERRVSMDDADHADQAGGVKGLEPAWSSADETKWQTYIDDNGNNLLAFQEATLAYPLVFAAYQIPADFDYLKTTKYEGIINGRVRKHPKIRPELLTGVQFDSANPRNWLPRPITFEWFDGTDWVILTQIDRLEVSLGGGYFLIPGLRDSGDPASANDTGFNINPNHPTWNGTIANAASIVTNNIRCTLAIECDFRISGRAGETLDFYDSYSRVFHDEGQHQITTYIIAAPPLDYVEWLREDSFPMGELQALPAGFPDIDTSLGRLTDKSAAGEELFSDRTGNAATPDQDSRITRHALSRLGDVKRVEASGQIVLKQFQPGLVPGTIIGGFKKAGIQTSGIVKSIRVEANSQDVFIELG